MLDKVANNGLAPRRASLVSSRPAARAPALARLDGWGINTPNMTAAIAAIIAAARGAGPFTVFTLNLDHLVKLRSNAVFQAAYCNADIVTADGAPIAWLARLQNPEVGRAPGSDMVVPLMQAAAEASIPVFLFGSSRDVLFKAARELRERTNGVLDIVGAAAPSVTFDPEGEEADLAIDTIAEAGARLCIVALSAPKQEIFADRARARGIPCGMVCVGATLDFLAGTQVRAPRLFRVIGLEWLWRLATDPRRLARRYADCAIVLADLVLLAPIRRRTARTGA